MERVVALPLGPWSFPINQLGRAGSLELSLLSMSVVDSIIRVAAVACVRHRPDLRIERLPGLLLQPLDGAPLTAVSSHLLPHAGAAWIEWLYVRPARLPLAYAAEVEQIEMAYRAGGRADAERVGPLRFEFKISGRLELADGGWR